MANATKLALALIGTASLFAATQASAAEPFSGPYVGGEIGWQQDKLRGTMRTGIGALTASDDASGFAYGGQIGYDFKLSEKFVLGAEAFVGGDTGKIRDEDTWADGGRAFGLTARAGVLAGPQSLVYVKGGWENGRFTFFDGEDRVSRNRDGWTIGAGFEQMLTPNVSARVEYRHTKFNSFNVDLTEGDASARFNRNRVMAGVNFRF
ncbi:outer membrane beta-barrel protein [Sandaracinobacter sp. RS1-74]|uniref:outer membrane protein n=1 Tax=Sandaracinobacteroides sayramensis TaxID=2913411 RepID=UPI001EDB57AF|nr:outer membrane beta-barrel protein [Sandaracinobacteroides sayramensis]MCG2839441.1 outer membrane beta-barrel protein [Sandaracinobacteroides sayramensis]